MLSAAMSVAQVIASALGRSTGVQGSTIEAWLGPTLASVIGNPLARSGLWLAVVPLALWLGYELFRLTERRTAQVTLKAARSRR
jgi:hypothetical protein